MAHGLCCFNMAPDADLLNGTDSRSPNSGVPRDADLGKELSTTVQNYRFPHNKLRRVLRDKTKIPLLLVACGSFSPPTFLHMRMFELASDYVRDNTDFEVIGGYLSPVSDAYKKDGLEKADARVTMCQLATADSDWVMVDNYEALSAEYIRTAQVLDHFNEALEALGGVATDDGETKQVRVALLAGADLIATFGTPGVWDAKDLEHILGRYGCFILERTGTNIDESLERLDKWISNIWFINQPVTNDVSSTKIRLFLKKDLSIRYLIPGKVIEYIYANGLFGVGNGKPRGHVKRPSDGLHSENGSNINVTE